jgi:hypothetical protein
MSSTRIIVVAAALVAAALAAESGSATAQTAQPAATPGKPIQLLQILERPEQKGKAKSSTKTVAKPAATKHTASRSHHKSKARKTAKHVATPAPAKDAEATPAVTAAEVTKVDPPADPTLAFAEPMADVITVGGQSVRVASPDDVNDIDRAADTPDKLLRSDNAEVAPAAEAASPTPADAKPTDKPTDKPTVAAAAADPSPTEKAEKPKGSWMAQALAALGGAIVAASAAWFLIGSAPQRLYG